MKQKNIPYLCGGTLLLLLERTKKADISARKRSQGINDSLSNPEMLKGLINVVTGVWPQVYDESFKKNTSQYRKCEIRGNTYITFNDKDTINRFDSNVKGKYSNVVCRMIGFTNRFISRSKSDRLVRELVEVILKDQGISDNDYFYIKSDGSAITKADLIKQDRFDLQPFLVGVLYYILLHRQDNTLGKATFDDWCEEAPPHIPRKIRDNFLIGSKIKLTVSWCNISDFQHFDNSSPKPEEKNDHDNTSDPSSDDDDHPTATVVVEETPSNTETQQQTTIIHNQTNVVQYGEKSISLVNNGTINKRDDQY